MPAGLVKRIAAGTLVCILMCPAFAGDAQKAPKVRTLLWLGGPVHDFRAIGDVVEKALQDYGRFEATRVEEDLDAFLPDQLKDFDLVIFFNTLGEIAEEQYLMDHDSRVTVLCAGIYRGEWKPAAWVKNWGKGRVFYSALGHDAAACSNQGFQRLLLRGSVWAAGQENLEPGSKPGS